MSSGAFALNIEQQAGLGPNSAIQRVVPLPPAPSQNGIHFDRRRLTLSYDNLAGGPDPITVTGRFLPKSLNVPINVTIPAGQCHVVEIPPRACAASLVVQPLPPATPPPPRGALTALVEYNS